MEVDENAGDGQQGDPFEFDVNTSADDARSPPRKQRALAGAGAALSDEEYDARSTE